MRESNGSRIEESKASSPFPSPPLSVEEREKFPELVDLQICRAYGARGTLKELIVTSALVMDNGSTPGGVMIFESTRRTFRAS